ncbi:MAG: diguanylate cyclase [Mesorhizobium sp.]|nr:MAG: diguanylate cyclase [Mesorhizobium sp.]
MERIVLQKFPACCPYCLKKPCSCWTGAKPTVNDKVLNRQYYRISRSQKRTISDFDLMFAEIYGDSWESTSRKQSPIAFAYIRLTEELAELSEAVRFYHIYPKNFENELADFFAWWFALSHLIRKEMKAELEENRSTEDLIWEAYPGRCRDCYSAPCFCPQGPVRELMSKPVPGQSHEIDDLTALRNQGAYKLDIEISSEEGLALPSPISCVRCDVDDFKTVNTDFGHDAGDAALKHIATVLRNKARQRDRLYRVGGDEFAMMMPDTTGEEAKGLMIRVIKNLSEQPVRWVDVDGRAMEFEVTMSVGVAECATVADIEAGFAHADAATYISKDKGKAQVSIWVEP